MVKSDGQFIIHKKNCSAILQANPDRVYDAFWEIQKASKKKMRLGFEFDSGRPGILATLVNIPYSLEVNILAHEGKNHEDG